MTLCVSVSLSATVALVCLFGPKLHVIAFQSHKNVRKLTMNADAAPAAGTGRPQLAAAAVEMAATAAAHRSAGRVRSAGSAAAAAGDSQTSKTAAGSTRSGCFVINSLYASS